MVLAGFPGSSAEKESGCNAGDPGSIPGLGRSPGEGIAYPLQYFGLENFINRTGVRNRGPQRVGTTERLSLSCDASGKEPTC